MKPFYKTAFLCFSVALLLFTIMAKAQTHRPDLGLNLLPWPEQIVKGEGTLRLAPGTPVKMVMSKRHRLWLLPEIRDVFPESVTVASAKKGSSECALRFTQDANSVAVNGEEGYSIDITPKGIAVSAVSEKGLFYALQTLRQLRRADGAFPLCHINDMPKYAWRGLMLDVSRHFRDVAFLKKQVDAMAQYKLNILHLHLTDKAGWRLQVRRYPKLTEWGAWRPQPVFSDWDKAGRLYSKEGSDTAFGGYYTRQEMKNLVAYAARKNVTIVPEIEMPAHSGEVTTAYPELSCSGRPYTDEDLCPGNPATYLFVERVLKDVAAIFPSEYLHVGGDEAGKQAWGTCARCRAMMEREGLKTVDELQNFFMNRVAQIVHRLGRKMIGWDEIMAGGDLPRSTTLMVWHGLDCAEQALQKGYNVVLSPGKWCYLDAVQDAPHTQPFGFGGYRSLEHVYSFCPDSLSARGEGRVLGVQGNLWAEYIPTAEHAEYMLYPRILALAETGWTKNRKSYDNFRLRTLKALDHLRKKGYRTFDLAHEVGERAESREPVRALSVGCPVHYVSGWNPYYPACGARTLTDGLRGGWTYGDGRWQGFIGSTPLDVTIDLGEEKPIHTVHAELMQVRTAEIFYPGNVVIQTSCDGKVFDTLKEEHYESDATHFGFRTYGWQGETKARYVRFSARPGKERGWLFTDEIIVD